MSHRSTVTDIKYRYYIQILTAERKDTGLLRWRLEFDSQQFNFFFFSLLPNFTDNKRGFTELMLKLHVVSLKYYVFSLTIHEIYLTEEHVKPSRNVSLSELYQSVSVKFND